MAITPAVSVIIPTFNRAHIVLRAVKSVLGQTWSDLELIVVDDASTDDTPKVLSSVKDDRLRYIRHPKNLGGSQARNTGIAAARGNLIAFQDSDDEWLPEKLSKQIPLLRSAGPKTCGVFCGMERLLNNRFRKIQQPDFRTASKNWHLALLANNFIGTPAVILRRECLDSIGGFDASLPRYQDWDLWLRLSNCYDWTFVDEVLVKVYDQKNSISANLRNAAVALERILNKWNNRLSCALPAFSRLYLRLGVLWLKADEFEKSRSAITKAVELDGWSPSIIYWWLRHKFYRHQKKLRSVD